MEHKVAKTSTSRTSTKLRPIVRKTTAKQTKQLAASALSHESKSTKKLAGFGLWKMKRVAEHKILSGQETILTNEVLSMNFEPRFSAEEISTYILPARTMARRKKADEPLTQSETDRALRLARILTEAERVFANAEKADRWLRTANSNFSGQTPLSLLKSEAGGILVEQVLGQIDHGMFA
jgi:putative toxin-antitoxin system antitoxin component (TIGR02293 family)